MFRVLPAAFEKGTGVEFEGGEKGQWSLKNLLQRLDIQHGLREWIGDFGEQSLVPGGRWKEGIHKW